LTPEGTRGLIIEETDSVECPTDASQVIVARRGENRSCRGQKESGNDDDPVHKVHSFLGALVFRRTENYRGSQKEPLGANRRQKDWRGVGRDAYPAQRPLEFTQYERIVLFLLSLTFTAAIASGQAMDNKQMRRRLGLTDDQISQFTVIQREARPEIRAAQQDMRAAEKQLAQLLLDSKADLKKIERLVHAATDAEARVRIAQIEREMAARQLIGGRRSFEECGVDLPRMLDAQIHGELDSWAIRWTYAHFAHHAVCLVPVESLVNNIGADGSGLHMKPSRRYLHPTLNDARLMRFPPLVYVDPLIERTYKTVERKGHVYRAARKWLARTRSVEPDQPAIKMVPEC